MQNIVIDNIKFNKILVQTDETAVNISQPVTNIVETIAAGPQGPTGPQGPQGPVGSVFPYTGSAAITGSLTVIGSTTSTSFTGSLFGTASYATQALSSSLSITSSNTILQSSIITNQTVGGLSSGTTLSIGSSIEAILNQILVTYIAPTLGSFSLLNGASTVLNSSPTNQVGTSITYNTASFTAIADNPNGRFPYSASFTASNSTNDFTYYFGNNVLGTSNNLSLGSSRTSTRTSDGTITFTLRSINPQTGAVISNTRTITYVYPIFYGMSATDYSTAGNLSSDGSITTLVQSKGTKALSITGTNAYIYFAYPASYGNLTSIKDGNNFEVLSSFNKYIRNQDGASSYWSGVSYNIYIGSWNGSILNKTTVSPAQTYTFTF
jgi:hypothetical protein